MELQLPAPTIHRLCLLYRLLEHIAPGDDGEDRHITEISSARLGRHLGVTADTIRKDISLLGDVESSAAGYSAKDLKRLIAEELGLEIRRRACVVGLSDLGAGLIDNPSSFFSGIEVIAGFDGDINRIEMMKTSIPLYPAYDIPDVVKKEKIVLAALNVEGGTAQKMADRLVAGGIRGIVNFSPVVLSVPEKVFVRNTYVLEEFRILSSFINLDKGV